MKIRVKLEREGKVVDLGDRGPSEVTLGELRQSVIIQFPLTNHTNEHSEFQLSLNKKDALCGEHEKLSTFGIVAGDLVHVIGHGSLLGEDASVRSHERRQPIAPHCPGASHAYCDNAGTSSFEECLTEKSMSGISVAENKDTTDQVHARSNPMNMDAESVIISDLNRYLREPLVIRESTATQVPILLHQLYSSTNCESASDALWVVVHCLMLEAGFNPNATPDPTIMPNNWKRAGSYYVCEYTYAMAPEITGGCTLTGITLGSSIAVHGLPKSDSRFKTEALHLTASHYVRDLSQDVPAVYRALDKLSRLVKDTVCLPLLNEIVTAAGYPVGQGLLALPREITIRILTFLDIKSLCRVSRSSQEMNAIVKDKTVWRLMFMRDFGKLADNSLNKDWYQIYKEKYLHVKEEQVRGLHLLIEPRWGPPVGPFRPLHPQMPFPNHIIGGDYDLNPEFAAGLPNPMGLRSGGMPGRTGPAPRGLDPFGPQLPGQRSGPRRGGSMTGSPFSDPFRGSFF